MPFYRQNRNFSRPPPPPNDFHSSRLPTTPLAQKIPSSSPTAPPRGQRPVPITTQGPPGFRVHALTPAPRETPGIRIHAPAPIPRETPGFRKASNMSCFGGGLEPGQPGGPNSVGSRSPASSMSGSSGQSISSRSPNHSRGGSAVSSLKGITIEHSGGLPLSDPLCTHPPSHSPATAPSCQNSGPRSIHSLVSSAASSVSGHSGSPNPARSNARTRRNGIPRPNLLAGCMDVAPLNIRKGNPAGRLPVPVAMAPSGPRPLLRVAPPTSADMNTTAPVMLLPGIFVVSCCACAVKAQCRLPEEQLDRWLLACPTGCGHYLGACLETTGNIYRSSGCRVARVGKEKDATEKFTDGERDESTRL